MRRFFLLAALLAATSAAASSEKQLLWGDTHLHTNNSFDAITIGNKTIDPAAAYRYARGLPVPSPSAIGASIGWPSVLSSPSTGESGPEVDASLASPHTNCGTGRRETSSPRLTV